MRDPPDGKAAMAASAIVDVSQMQWHLVSLQLSREVTEGLAVGTRSSSLVLLMWTRYRHVCLVMYGRTREKWVLWVKGL